MLMIRSEKSSQGQSLDSSGDEGGDKFKASICRSNGGETRGGQNLTNPQKYTNKREKVKT